MHDTNRPTACGCCGGALLPRMEGVFDDRYGQPGVFGLAQCHDCGVTETLPRLTEKELPALYTTYYPRRNLDPSSVYVPGRSPSHWRSKFSRWWQGTDNQGQYDAKPGMTVLDYGCGAGQSLLELRAMGADAYGIEADGNVARIAAHYGLQIHIGSIYDHPFPTIKFDLIVLNQVLEHIPEPLAALNLLTRLLKAGGRLVVAVPNTGSIYHFLFGKHWINWHIPYHLHHFNRASLRSLAQRAGWRIVSVRTVTPNLWTVLQLRTLTSPAQRGVPNLMWLSDVSAAFTTIKPHLGRRALSRAIQAGARVSIPLIALFNRMIDLCGLGDSLLVVFERRDGQENATGADVNGCTL